MVRLVGSNARALRTARQAWRGRFLGRLSRVRMAGCRLNGCLPLASSYSKHPSAYTSATQVNAAPSRISGAAYPGVQALTRLRLTGAKPSSVPAFAWPRPKSNKRTPSSLSNTLLGLRSPCSTPRSWACATASSSGKAISCNADHPNPSGRSHNKRSRVGPRNNSITINTRWCVVSTSKL